MNRLAAFFFVAAAMLPASIAYADIPRDPCEGKAEGDTCETYRGNPGTCQGQGADSATPKQGNHGVCPYADTCL